MLIDNVSCNNSFGLKQRFVNPKSRENIQSLLKKMDSETKMEIKDLSYKTTITKRLRASNDKFEFSDDRALYGRIPEDQKHVLFTIGKSELVIEKDSGKILDYYKPFYITWNRLFKNIEKISDFILNNFDDSKKIKKVYFEKKGNLL